MSRTKEIVDNGDGTSTVFLTQGKTCLIDTVSAPQIENYSWSYQNGGYARAWIDGRMVQMHRHLLGVSNEKVKHLNGNRLDNRLSNLVCVNKRPVVDNGDGTSAVSLTHGMTCLIDTSSAPLVGGYNWACTEYGYARGWVNGQLVYMHRLITAAPDDMQVDHISGDKLDNRLMNLRVCTFAENQQNRGKLTTNSSGLKGVSWHSAGKAWVAQIHAGGKRLSLGLFPSKEEAYEAYCAAVEQLHGEFGRTA